MRGRRELLVLVRAIFSKENIDIRKNTYWSTMGCCASRMKLLLFTSFAEEVCFSIRAQVRYTSKSRSRTPRRIIDGYIIVSMQEIQEARKKFYIKLIMLPHQGIMQQMSIHLSSTSATFPLNPSSIGSTHLRLNQHQINKQHYKIMLYVFIAEPPAILAHGEAHAMPCGAVIGARVFGVKGFDGVATFYADWHCMSEVWSSAHRGWGVGLGWMFAILRCGFGRRVRLLGLGETRLLSFGSLYQYFSTNLSNL